MDECLERRGRGLPLEHGTSELRLMMDGPHALFWLLGPTPGRPSVLVGSVAIRSPDCPQLSH